MVHGDNINRSDDKTLTLGIARALKGRSFGIFIFDMSGQGHGPATISSSGFFKRLDLQGIFDYLVSKGADRTRIWVLGFSLGGAVIADSSFADFSLALRNSMTGIKRPLILILHRI